MIHVVFASNDAPGFLSITVSDTAGLTWNHETTVIGADGLYIEAWYAIDSSPILDPVVIVLNPDDVVLAEVALRNLQDLRPERSRA